MSKLTAAQRKKLDDSDFGWPEKKLYPIMDQSDVDAAATLVGKAPDSEQAKIKRRIIAICKRKGLKPPAAWVEDKGKLSAMFALDDDATDDGDMVIRRGKVFEAGDYEDKGFDITPEEMLGAIAEFEPVPLDVEHRPSIFDGKLGELRSVELADNGWDLVGEIAIPRWLHEVIGDAPVKVSTQWDKAAKRLDKLALVIDPRVSDAAMMSGWAMFALGDRHDTYDGQRVMQDLHDVAAKAGAVCNPNNPPPRDKAMMHSAHELQAVQAAHDTAVQHGAKCNNVGSGHYPSAYFAGQRHSAADLKDFQSVHDVLVKHGVACDPSNVPATMSGQKGKSMDKMDKATFLEKMWAFFTGEVAVPAASTTPNVAATPLPPTVDPEKEAMRVRLAKLEADQIAASAAAFADAEITANRAYPAERDALIVAFSQAAQDDAKHGAVTFAGGAQGSRVDALKALYAARPAHGLTTERLQPGATPAGAVLLNKQETPDPNAPKPLTQEELDRLLAMTSVGQAALKARKNGN